MTLKVSIEEAIQMLEKQSTRIEQFHRQSLTWHRQHNAAIVQISELISRMHIDDAEANTTTTTTTPPPHSAPRTAEPTQRPLREEVASCLARASEPDLRALLSSVGLTRWRSLGGDLFTGLLPVLASWLNDPTMSDKALGMLYEGTKLWGEVLAKPDAGPSVAFITRALRAMLGNPARNTSDAADLLRAIESFSANEAFP